MNQIWKLQQNLINTDFAFLISDSANRVYLTGMHSSAGAVLITAERAWLIIDFRYYEEALKTVKNCVVVQEEQLYEQIKAFHMKIQDLMRLVPNVCSLALLLP